jgi:hypothetical protein
MRESSESASSVLHSGAVPFSVSVNTLNFERSLLRMEIFEEKCDAQLSTERLL